MALDIYVGSFTRYYTGEWETVAAAAAREQGLAYQVIRSGASDEPAPDADEVRGVVSAWREQLSQGLGDNLETPLAWDEGGAAPYFTDRPAWDCYGALLLWAAYAESPHLPRPVANVPEFAEDPAYRRSSDPEYSSLYSQLVRDIELWLPGDFSFTFVAPAPNGGEVGIGSSVALLKQLEVLNQRTWNADAATLATWRHDGAESGAPLEVAARFAFAVMHELARKAVALRLPMKLDY